MFLLPAVVAAAVVVAVAVVVVVAVVALTLLAASAVADALTDAEAEAAEEMSEDDAGDICEECLAALAEQALQESQEGLTPPIVSHLWQEYHTEAATNVYTGPTGEGEDHTKVAENADASGSLQPKTTLHLCFLESAIATVEAEVAEGQQYKMRWWIERPDGTIQEHPDFTEASPGTLRTGKYAWRWDGRKRRSEKGSEADRVYCPPGAYTSKIRVTDAAGTPVIEGEDCKRTITLEGDPYRIYIHALPKPTSDLWAERNRHKGWLGDSGNYKGRRFPSDCWIMVYRGVDNDPGHMVFLGHGAMEATRWKDTTHCGDVGTPQGRTYKGWIRTDRKGDPPRADCIQLEDVERTDDKVILKNPGGPAPINPSWSDTFKMGVQIHREGYSQWVGKDSSYGCTRVWPSKESNSVSAAYMGVRCNASAFGTFGTTDTKTWREINDGGPPFVNKQTKRSRVEDAHIADSHSSLELNPPGSGASTDPDEPLHMQPTFQKGAFGGFLKTEIPLGAGVEADPDGQLRIRASLWKPASSTMYYTYHHAVAFGHSDTVSGTKHALQAWIPYKVLRTWNGQQRNVKVESYCQVAWYIERRWVENGQDRTEVVHRLGPSTGQNDAYANLPTDYLGKAEESWDPGSSPQKAGRYYSVLKYKLQLLPYSKDTVDDWTPEEAMTDLMSSGSAQLAAEEKSDPDTNGDIFLEGRNELELQGINTATP
jgi:hypothetical protein